MNITSRDEHLNIIMQQLHALANNEQALKLLDSNVEQYPLMEALEKCGIYEMEELLLLGSDYVPPENQKFSIQTHWDNGGERGVTTVTLVSGEHKIVITYDNDSDTVTLTSKSDETNQLLKQYLIGRHLKLVH